jgi:hypothetical protein
MKRLTLLLLLVVQPVLADAIATTPTGVVVAHGNSIELFDDRGVSRWRTDGVTLPMKIVTSSDRAAVIDPLANTVRIVDLRTGKATTAKTGETPIDATFAGRDLFVLDRDSSTVSRITPDGKTSSIRVAADPAFLRQSGGRLYVYSRLDGVLQEIGTAPFAVRKTVTISNSASDMEVDARNVYLLYPRAAKIRAIELKTFKQSGEIPIGAVPIDLALAGGANAVSARTLAVADPSGKRVWITEGAQSLTQAISRGFLRGLLGLGLYSNKSSEFATGVDRVAAGGKRWIAYDSSTGTLYRVTRDKSTAIAKDVDPAAFAMRGEVLFYWQKGHLYSVK